MGGAQVQSLTPTPLKHFGPLKGVVGAGTKKDPFFEPPWYLGSIRTHAFRAATSQSTHAKSNLADHLIMIYTNVISDKPCYEQSGRDAVAKGVSIQQRRSPPWSPLSLLTTVTVVVAAHTPCRGGGGLTVRRPLWP